MSDMSHTDRVSWTHRVPCWGCGRGLDADMRLPATFTANFESVTRAFATTWTVAPAGGCWAKVAAACWLACSVGELIGYVEVVGVDDEQLRRHRWSLRRERSGLARRLGSFGLRRERPDPPRQIGAVTTFMLISEVRIALAGLSSRYTLSTCEVGVQ